MIFVLDQFLWEKIMKKISFAAAVLFAATGAQAYQFEVQGTVGYYDADFNDGNYNVGAQGTYYLKDIDTSKGPLAEAAFLNQATSITAGYNYGQLSGNQAITYGGTTYSGKFDVDQHTYGAKAETYIPTKFVPVYASASYNHSYTDAKNDFTASLQNDDNGDRFALELGALVAPNFLLAVGYTSVVDQNSLDTFNVLNNGLISATMESRAIAEDQDAITARTKYVGGISDTNMAVGFEAGLVYGEDTLYQLKSDLYLNPAFSVGVSYAEGSFKSASVPKKSAGANVNYFLSPTVSVGASYVYSSKTVNSDNPQLGALNAKFRF